MNQNELLREILRTCQWYGLLAYVAPDTRRLLPGASAGWPDLAIAGPRGVIFREVKGDGDSITDAQEDWGMALCDAGLNWAVWDTTAWATRQVEIELGRLGAPRITWDEISP